MYVPVQLSPPAQSPPGSGHQHIVQFRLPDIIFIYACISVLSDIVLKCAFINNIWYSLM